MLTTGTQRTIAPRGSVPERNNPNSRESAASRASAVHGESVSCLVIKNIHTKVLIFHSQRDGQFYIVGAATDMLTGGTQRTIAPRGNVPERNMPISRESAASSAHGHGEPVSCHFWHFISQNDSFNSPVYSLQRDDRRRVSHNEVERRRRDKINNWILKLGKIMPDSVHNDAGKTGQVIVFIKL